MAVFLTLDGIEGESRTPATPSEIDVASWSLGVTNPGPGHSGGAGGGGAGRATFMDLRSPSGSTRPRQLLMLAVAAGGTCGRAD